MRKLWIKPFNEFWIDCLFNSYFSLLTSISKKYNDLAYLNGYIYVEKEEDPKGISIDNLGRMQRDVINTAFSRENFSFKNESDDAMVENIISILDKHYLFAGVDLFEWIPDSICWKKYHWYHYSLVTEYENETDSFIVLDEDLHGFDTFRISKKQLISGARNYPFDTDGFVITLKDNPADFVLDLPSIKINAKRIQKNIDHYLQSDSVWNLSPENIELGDYFDLFSMYAYQIMNRQTANLKLIKRMLELNWIDPELYELLCKQFEEIKTGWEIIKNIFMKSNLSLPRSLDIEKLKSLKHAQLVKERHAWGLVFDAI